MRRLLAALSSAALVACGASTTPINETLPDDDGPLFGAIVAVGENWRLTGDPTENAISISMDNGVEVSGTWVHPYYVEGRVSAGDIRITLENAACEIDRVPYPMSATVTFPNHTLTGCAAMRWDSNIDTLLPDIDACIAAAPELRTVTYAGELPDGAVLVRVRNGDDLQDCRIERGRARHSPRDESLRMATEDAAIFLRARPGEKENPGGECYEAPEVFYYTGHPAIGEMVGWSLDPAGC